MMPDVGGTVASPERPNKAVAAKAKATDLGKNRKAKEMTTRMA